MNFVDLRYLADRLRPVREIADAVFYDGLVLWEEEPLKDLLAFLQTAEMYGVDCKASDGFSMIEPVKKALRKFAES